MSWYLCTMYDLGKTSSLGSESKLLVPQGYLTQNYLEDSEDNLGQRRNGHGLSSAIDPCQHCEISSGCGAALALCSLFGNSCAPALQLEPCSVRFQASHYSKSFKVTRTLRYPLFTGSCAYTVLVAEKKKREDISEMRVLHLKTFWKEVGSFQVAFFECECGSEPSSQSRCPSENQISGSSGRFGLWNFLSMTWGRPVKVCKACGGRPLLGIRSFVILVLTMSGIMLSLKHCIIPQIIDPRQFEAGTESNVNKTSIQVKINWPLQIWKGQSMTKCSQHLPGRLWCWQILRLCCAGVLDYLGLPWAPVPQYVLFSQGALVQFA